MSQLLQVPPVGINSDFISESPRTFIVQGKFLSSKSVVTLEDGTPVFNIQPESFSVSHRINLLDANSEHEIFHLRKHAFESKYFVQQSTDGGEERNLAELSAEMGFSGGLTTTVNFANIANNGAATSFEYKVRLRDSIHTVMWDDKPVAEIEKKSMSMKGHTTIRLAPGVDALPVLAIVMALADRSKFMSASGMTSAVGNT